MNIKSKGVIMVKILVVEDDRALNGLVATCLRDNGYDVKSCFDGVQALDALENAHYSMIISDIMMPRMDGFELAESIRLTDKSTPIIFMSAKDDKPSKLYGYKIGIDDYITKPFDIDVLVMKVAAVLRRAQIENDKTISIGNFTMNADEHTATLDGEDITLTVREFDIIFKFLSYPKKTFTRSALMEEFWDYDSSATSRTVDVYIAKIREKTKDAIGFEIQTVHGLGYKVVLK